MVFYEGHLPAFGFNTLVRKTLGEPGIDPALELLFARGIDPDERAAGANPGAAGGPGVDVPRWPEPAAVERFAAEADERVEAALTRLGLDDPNADPGALAPPVREAVFTILEHEAMHQETLMYMWHRVPLSEKRRPPNYAPRVGSERPRAPDFVEVPGGMVTLGATRRACFGWDNELPSLAVRVQRFAIDRGNVTNAAYLEFVEGGGYRDSRWWRPEDWEWIRTERIEHPCFWERESGRWHWRGMFDRLLLPLSWPVYVSLAEATAFAAWKGGRLPTEAEYHRAAFGSHEGERPYPWGHEPPDARFGVFDWTSWDPEPVGDHPRGASAWGVEDLVGNGWEWTSSAFGPFPGFQPMASYPKYSADFFDGNHFVIKGASPVTDRTLIRASFRNWFRARYPYVYATFRCVTPAA